MRILRILPSAKSDLDLKVKEAGATPASVLRLGWFKPRHFLVVVFFLLRLEDERSNTVDFKSVPGGIRYAQLRARAVSTATFTEVFTRTTLLGVCLQFGSLDNLYCRYTLSFGNDWYIVHVSMVASRRNFVTV